MGTVDGKLYALDADSGKPCENFADKGVLNVNQWNTVNAKFPLSLLQPPTVVGDHLIVGWAGKDWAYAKRRRARCFQSTRRPGHVNGL